MPRTRPYPAEYRQQIIELARAGTSAWELGVQAVVLDDPPVDQAGGPRRRAYSGRPEHEGARGVSDGFDVRTGS